MAKHRTSSRAPHDQPSALETPAKRIYRPVTRKQRTFYVSDALYGQIRSAVVHLAGPPEFLTMTAFFERAAQTELARLQRKHRDGKPFPALAEGIRPRPGARPAGAPTR